MADVPEVEVVIIDNPDHQAMAAQGALADLTALVKSWKDLLDPKWRGRLVTAHPGYSGVIATHVLALVHLHGWDYFKALAQNKPMLVQSAVDPSGVVASGERPVAVAQSPGPPTSTDTS